MEKLKKIGFSKLTFIEDAIKKLEPFVYKIGHEEIDINNSLDRVLADNIISPIDVPPFDRSAMDGYAVVAEDTFGASHSNPKSVILKGIVEIGEFNTLKIEKSEAIRISTGAPIPEGANGVVKIEETELKGNTIKIYSPITPLKNISKKGEDMVKGTEVLRKGIEIKPEHIALLSSLGIKTIPVKLKPKISIFSVGDELVEVGNALVQGKIYNSNGPMISNLVQLYGGAVIQAKTLLDDKDLIIKHLKNSVKDSDLIIFTGGTSVGTKDLLPEIIQENGKIITHGIAMRPGTPILTSIIDNTLTFCLPGTPVAAYIGFLLIIGPTIRRLMECTIIDPRIEISAIISKDIPVSGLGFLNCLRVKIEKHEGQLLAIPIRLKGSGILSSLTNSDGIVEIAPFQEGLRKGESVFVKRHPV
ncbi:MAG: molybdopterin molybdotransferase MoeA [Promethearchaeota archaeon]